MEKELQRIKSKRNILSLIVAFCFCCAAGASEPIVPSLPFPDEQSDCESNTTEESEGSDIELSTTMTETQTDYSLMNFRKPVLELYMPTINAAETNKYQLTWMRTNPGVKPYKIIDDLTFVGVPVFTAGIIAKSEKKSFRQNTKDNKHTLLTDFKTHIDDYSQFFGPVMTTGLKIAGVEGRSDWGRYIVSAAMSYGIMAGFVNGIKYTAKEMRPDGSTRNSWPSGHTATAFVGATILHKEYGMTRSPWYSVAGYGVATATGVMRVLNNRHWVSDVLSGAGIGIMSGELAYALSDVLFKDKGLLRGELARDKSIIDHPSFFSVSMGIGFGSKNLDFDMGNLELEFDGYDDGDKKLNLKFGASTAVSAEGAYFFNKYIGVGGRLRVNSSPIKGWDGIESYAWMDLINNLYGEDYNNEVIRELVDGVGTPGQPGYSPALVEDANFTIKSDHLTEFAADLGLYFNLPLSKRFAMGSKLLVGRSIMQELDLNATITGGKRDLYINDEDDIGVRCLPDSYTSEWDYFTLSGNNTMKCGTGLSLTYAYKENYAWRLFFDYDFTRKTYTMTYNPAEFVMDALGWNDPSYREDEVIEQQSIKKNRHTFILGGSFTVSF